jgi:hypothetical protein
MLDPRVMLYVCGHTGKKLCTALITLTSATWGLVGNSRYQGTRGIQDRNYDGQSKGSRNGGIALYGKAYGSAYLARASTHTHIRTHTLAPSILPLFKAPTEGFFWNLPEFGRRIRIRCETCPLEAHFQSREQPEVTRSEIRRVRWLGDNRNCCTTSDVWLGALSWCRNHCPCLPFVAPLPLQNLHVEMAVTFCLGVRTHGAPNHRGQSIPGTF